MIHSAIVAAALSPLVGNRCWPVALPQEPLPDWPAIRYTPVGGTTYQDACGGGDASTDDQRVQVDCFAATYDDAVALCAQAREAMESLSVPTATEGPASFDYDPETKVYWSTQDFTIAGSSLD